MSIYALKIYFFLLEEFNMSIDSLYFVTVRLDIFIPWFNTISFISKSLYGLFLFSESIIFFMIFFTSLDELPCTFTLIRK